MKFEPIQADSTGQSHVFLFLSFFLRKIEVPAESHPMEPTVSLLNIIWGGTSIK